MDFRPQKTGSRASLVGVFQKAPLKFYSILTRGSKDVMHAADFSCTLNFIAPLSDIIKYTFESYFPFDDSKLSNFLVRRV